MNSSLSTNIQENLAKAGIDGTGVRFLLAVSGGKDSMVLLHLFHNLEYSFEVATMNYQLRGEDSNEDAQLVQKVCAQFEIPFHQNTVDTKKFCAEHKVSTQEGARMLRYHWFDELLSDRKLDWVVTAHHEEDNKETFIQNLKRGSGLRGLKSMNFVHENKCKPMLNVSRELIDHYAVEEGISFREDASNNQNHYQRNLIRNSFLPAAEEMLPGLGNGIARSIEKLQSDYDFLISALNAQQKELLQKKADATVVPNFRKVHVRLLYHILESFGFNEVQMEDILRAKQGGKTVVNTGYGAQVHKTDLYVYELKEHSNLQLEITQVGTYDTSLGQIIVSELPADLLDKGRNLSLILDLEKVGFPFTIRNWFPGDRFQPSGLQGSKKIGDFLTDRGIPLFQKKNYLVIEKNSEILGIVDLEASKKSKVSDSTKNVLVIETFFHVSA